MRYPSGRANTVTYPRLDIVDICPLRPGTPALAAVSRDCTLVLFQDVLNDRNPITLNFSPHFRGTAYRLLQSAGHLLLLTSEGFYVIAWLAERFLAGERVDKLPSIVRPLACTAVDCNLVHSDRWLELVVLDGVIPLELNSVIGHPPNREPVSAVERAGLREQGPEPFTEASPATNWVHGSPSWDEENTEETTTEETLSLVAR
jgi:hypothetical protein